MYFKLTIILFLKKKEKQKLFKFLQPNYGSTGEDRDGIVISTLLTREGSSWL